MAAGDFLDDALDIGPGGMVPRPDAVELDSLAGFYARESRDPDPYRKLRGWEDGKDSTHPARKRRTTGKRRRQAARDARKLNRDG
jgi:hypothetical protein